MSVCVFLFRKHAPTASLADVKASVICEFQAQFDCHDAGSACAMRLIHRIRRCISIATVLDSLRISSIREAMKQSFQYSLHTSPSRARTFSISRHLYFLSPWHPVEILFSSKESRSCFCSWLCRIVRTCRNQKIRFSMKNLWSQCDFFLAMPVWTIHTTIISFTSVRVEDMHRAFFTPWNTLPFLYLHSLMMLRICFYKFWFLMYTCRFVFITWKDDMGKVPYCPLVCSPETAYYSHSEGFLKMPDL